jgi:hypothetical protein
MNTGKLSKQSCFNPYIFDGLAIAHIVIFDNGQEIGRINRGWIGSNNDGNNVLEALEIENRRTKRKLDVTGNTAFVMTAEKKTYSNDRELDLYIPASLLPGFEYLGEQLDFKSDTELHYGKFIQFNFGATSEHAQKYPHVTEIKPRKVMLGSYSRTELTAKGEQEKAIKAILKTCGNDSYINCDKLLEHSAELINLLKGGAK